MTQDSGDPGANATHVRAAQDGDLAAFNALVRAHQRQVYNLCYRTLGNSEDASDTTQEAFLSAYRNIGSFRGAPDGFRGWLRRSAVNACYDTLRKRKRRPSESLDALVAEAADGTAGREIADTEAPTPEEQALRSETGATIEQALALLSEDRRLTVVLCDVQGLSYDEAAAAMEVEVGTVKSRLSRARAQLREYLSVRGEHPTVSRRLEE